MWFSSHRHFSGKNQENKASKISNVGRKKMKTCFDRLFKVLYLLIACCTTLNILLANDVKDEYGKYEGVYTFQGLSDGMDYWVHADGENAIWYKRSSHKPEYYWVIGELVDLGKLVHRIETSSNTLEKKCPNNEGNVWNWNFYASMDSRWIATNDVYIKCANENDFCTYENPCGTDQGD